MKIFVVFSIFFIWAVFGQDDTCKNDFQTFVQCLKTEFQNTGGITELKADFRTKVTGCFQTAGCTAPDYDADPFADADFAQTIVQKYQSLTPDQKACIRNKMKARIQPKIEQCLNHPIPQWAQDAWDQFRDQNQLTDAQKADLKSALRAKLNILKAARQCNNKEALGKCLIDAQAQFGKDSCDRRHDCSKSASDACNQQANQFRDQVCKCIDQVKHDGEAQLQSVDQDPMAALSNLQARSGGWQADLNQCGVDTTAMMNDIRPKIGDYVLKKCKEAGLNPIGIGPLAVLSCAQQLKQTQGDPMKKLFGTLKDYMEQHGGVKDAICHCDF